MGSASNWFRIVFSLRRWYGQCRNFWYSIRLPYVPPTEMFENYEQEGNSRSLFLGLTPPTTGLVSGGARFKY
jgi:hypothetical protein